MNVAWYSQVHGRRITPLETRVNLYSSLTNKSTFLNLKNIKIYIKIHKYRSYIFRSSTIIRKLAPNLAKVIFMLKHSVELRRYLLCGCVAACCHTTA